MLKSWKEFVAEKELQNEGMWDAAKNMIGLGNNYPPLVKQFNMERYYDNYVKNGMSPEEALARVQKEIEISNQSRGQRQQPPQQFGGRNPLDPERL